MGEVIHRELTELPAPLLLKQPLPVQLHWCCEGECGEVDAWCEPLLLFAIGYGSEESAMESVGEKLIALRDDGFAHPFDRPGDAETRRAGFAQYVEVPA